MGNEETRDLLVIYGSMFIVFVVVFALVVVISQKRKELHLRRINELLKEKNNIEIEALRSELNHLKKLIKKNLKE